MKKYVTRAVLGAIYFLNISGCTDWPKEREAERDFKSDYPQYELLKCYPGEANSDTIYYHFEYRDSEGKLKTMRVLYEKSPNHKYWHHDRVDRLSPEDFPIILPNPSETN